MFELLDRITLNPAVRNGATAAVSHPIVRTVRERRMTLCIDEFCDQSGLLWREYAVDVGQVLPKNYKYP